MAARVKSVKKAQKDQGKCLKCGTEIKAGMPYRYFKRYRQRTKNLYCMKPECTPGPADTDSSKMATVYQAQQDALTSLDTDTHGLEPSDIRDLLDTVADAAEEVAGEYEEAISNAPMLEERYQERVDGLNDWASELRDVETDEYEEDETLDAEENDEQEKEHFDTMVDAARDAISNIPEA